jgi:hypothetical protein
LSARDSWPALFIIIYCSVQYFLRKVVKINVDQMLFFHR